MLDLPPELSPEILKAVRGFITFANDPTQTAALFDIADGLRQTDLYLQFIKYAHSHSAIAQILQERYLSSTPYRKITVEDDYSYIALRMRQTHDIWHIVTGFGTNFADEMGLQAFTLAQTRSPLAVAILAATVIHALKSSTPLNPLIERMQQGWSMGERAHPFLAQKWEEYWEKPLSEWRADLNIEAV